MDADSAVGAFVRACVADFAAAPFERAARSRRRWTRTGARGTASTTTPFGRRGDRDENRELETKRRDVETETELPNASSETLLLADARWDDAEAAAERADAAARRRDDLETDTSDTSGSDFQARFRERVEISLANLASRDGAGAAFAFPPPCDPLAFLKRAARPTRTAEATRVRDAMIRADAGEAPSRSLRDGVHQSAVPNDGFVDSERDDGFSHADNALDTDGGRFLAHLEYARRREFETAEACLRSHFDYVHPTVTGVPLKRSFTNEKERTGTHTDAFGFLPPEGLFFGPAGANAAGTATNTSADGQALSRRRLHAAALSLARAHVRAGRADEALKALNETVRVAQQDGDTGALAHAVAALCALSASSAAPVASREASRRGRRRRSRSRPTIRTTEDARRLRSVKREKARRTTAFCCRGSSCRRGRLRSDAARVRGHRERQTARGAPGGGRAEGAGGARAYRRRRRRGEARRIRGPGLRRPRRALAPCVRPPATAAAAARRVEALRHHAELGAAAPVPLFLSARATRRPPARAKGTERNGTPRTRFTPRRAG